MAPSPIGHVNSVQEKTPKPFLAGSGLGVSFKTFHSARYPLDPFCWLPPCCAAALPPALAAAAFWANWVNA